MTTIAARTPGRARRGTGASSPGRRAAVSAGDAMASREAVRLWLRLLSCTNLIEGRLRTGLRDKFGSTLPRFDVLAQLESAGREAGEHVASDSAGREAGARVASATAHADGGALTMSELSRRLMVSNGNLTGLTARLAREGLVTRGPARDDRRTQLVRLTPEGRRALRAMATQHHGWVARMFAGLSARERTALAELLGRLKQAVERATAAPRGGSR
jgi:DNA-binding MarR family transcriptional regulator